MTSKMRYYLSLLVLLVTAVVWGSAFVAQRAGMEHVGPYTFNGVRFLVGSIVLVPVLVLARKPGRRTPVAKSKYAAIMGCTVAGVVLFGAASLQQVGIVSTTAGKAGFITGLYVVFVPLLAILRKRGLGPSVWFGTALAVGGLYLLTVHGAFGLGIGDALVLASALGWAVHVHLIGWLAVRVSPITIAVTQFSLCGTLSLIVALLFEEIEIVRLAAAAFPIAYAGILSTGVAYTLQIVGQRRVDASRAGIVLSLEAVFAVLGGWMLLGEAMNPRMLSGCGLMLAGMIVSQLGKPSVEFAKQKS